MKNIIFSIFILIIFISLNARAEIAYIDINYLINSSDVGKFLNTQIEIKKKEYTVKHNEIENELRKKEKTLLSQKNILDEKEFEKKLTKLRDEVQEYRKVKQSNIDSLNAFKIDNTKKILNALNPIITEFVNLNSISLVIPKKNIIVGKKNLDITNQILKLLNKKITKLNF